MSTNKPSKQRSNHKQAAVRRQATIRRSGLILAVASHAAMGVSLGLVFALVLTSTPFFGVLPLINMSVDPATTMTTFVGTAALMFGVGAALTGFILVMEDRES